LWRGYVGTWKIENDSSFLVNIKIDYCGGNPVTINIKEEFGSDKVFADWVSSEIINPTGKQIKYIHQGYGSIYEYERGCKFVEGKLVLINNYDNTESRKSVYTSEPEALHKFLYKNINWELVGCQKFIDKGSVVVRFKIGKNEKPTAIEISRGVNQQMNKEAQRIVRLIPTWDIYYSKDKMVETQWYLPIFFDKEFYEK